VTAPEEVLRPDARPMKMGSPKTHPTRVSYCRYPVYMRNENVPHKTASSMAKKQMRMMEKWKENFILTTKNDIRADAMFSFHICDKH
jgi:hypothetical protein